MKCNQVEVRTTGKELRCFNKKRSNAASWEQERSGKWPLDFTIQQLLVTLENENFNSIVGVEPDFRESCNKRKVRK